MTRGEWVDPSRGLVTVQQWAGEWLATRHDLRPTTRARLDGSIRLQIVPGSTYSAPG